MASTPASIFQWLDSSPWKLYLPSSFSKALPVLSFQFPLLQRFAQILPVSYINASEFLCQQLSELSVICYNEFVSKNVTMKVMNRYVKIIKGVFL